MTRPLLIGEAPARTTPKDFPPFFGRERSAARLWEIGLRVSREAGRPGNVDAINLIPEWPGAKWPVDVARGCARQLVFGKKLAGRKRVVLVGRRVARAFGIDDDREWFKWFYLKTGDVMLFATMPHPSGLNRWWNEPGNLDSAKLFAQELIG